ncbi:hypothetical protein ABIF86_003502 [Bradyrhizobium japonicum]
MKTKLSGKLSHYDKMAASAQQFFTEATACREEAARSLDQVSRNIRDHDVGLRIHHRRQYGSSLSVSGLCRFLRIEIGKPAPVV